MGNKRISEFTRVNTIRDDDYILMNQLDSTCTAHVSSITDKVISKIPIPSLNDYIRKPAGGILGDSLVKDGAGEWVPKSTTSLVSPTTLNQGVVVAKGYFKLISLVTDTVINVPTFLNVIANRTNGDQFVTINYSGLPAKYKSLTDPFFVNGQYIGVSTVGGKLVGHLYMIENHNPTACTFRIDTVGATGAMINQSVQLTIALNNIDNNVLDAYNIKSVYIDIQSPSKYYINFKEDLYTGSKTNTAPTEIFSMMINGQGYTDARNLMIPYMLFNANRNNPAGKEAYEYHPDVGEGFGANSMGVHMGFFYTYNNGQNSIRISNAIFACIV